MDLTQVEALGDLIDAETDEQRRLARMGIEVSVVSSGGWGDTDGVALAG
jgi:tRNA U34 5-carboxymethylaminomethyl modifying GTPase MnmE/TrmE